jgi:hypothetical protein
VARILSWLNWVPDVADDGDEAFFDYGIDQFLSIMEVVVHHCRGEAGAPGYGGKAGSGYTLFGEKLGRCVKQLDARVAVGIGEGASRSFF